MKRRLTQLLLLCSVLAASGGRLFAQQYEVVDLGTLGGSSSYATGISADGTVVGWATLPSGVKHAVMWDGGEVIDLGAPEGFTVSSAAAVNDARQVAARSEGSPQSYQGYLWEDGAWTAIGVLPGQTDSSAADIDSSGRIVGSSFVVGSGGGRAVLWEAGSLMELGTLGSSSSASGINELGQIVGSARIELGGGDSESRGFLWEDGVMTTLEPPVDYSESSASDINDAGEVCGAASRFVPPYFSTHHATLWRGDEVIGLGTLYGYARSAAAGINNHGQIVGTAAASLSGGPYAAFVWQDGVMLNLNDLIASDSGWRLRGAADINDAGQIVGYGVMLPNDRDLRAFLLEPSTPCASDADCDDGLFCTGERACVNGFCRDGADPCPGLICDEEADLCLPASCDHDRVCELGENCVSCADDCLSSPLHACGDGVCQPGEGEDCRSCPFDCRGRSKGQPSGQFCCGADVDCTDARCNEDPWVCSDELPTPFCCGDASCDPGEDACLCEVDCGPPPATETECDDGKDNDCDMLTDTEDPDCCGQTGAPCLGDADCCSGRCKTASKWPSLGTCR